MTIGNGSASLPEQSTAERARTRVLRAVLAMPFAKVDRKAFLRAQLAPYCTEQQVIRAVESRPAQAAIRKELIDTLADSCIKAHVLRASGTSFKDASGLHTPLTVMWMLSFARLYPASARGTLKNVILGALLLTCLACATSAPDPPPTLTYTQENITTTPASVPRPTVFKRNASLYTPPATYYPAPTATPAFTKLDVKKCRKFQLEMESEWFRKTKTDAEAVQLIDYCNQYLEQTIFGPIPTLAPTIWPTPTIRARATPTLIPWPTSTPRPWPTDTPVPLTKQEVRATLDAHRAGVGLDTPTPVLPTATPFPVSDGVSAVPLIEAAWVYLDGRVDTDGVYLNREQMTSIWWGIGDYYALDFERRCLTERGTLAVIDQVMDLDYPGNTLHFPDSRHSFHSGASSFSGGKLSATRRGDWDERAVEWTLYYPPGLGKQYENLPGEERYYLRLWVMVNVATCEPVRDSYSGDFFSVMKTPIPLVRQPAKWECIYKPIREEELGRRDDIDERSYNCATFRYGW